MSLENRLKLVTQSDGVEQIIIPQLKESAAWLASLDEKLFEQLASLDPETLIQSDVVFDEISKQVLTKLLLQQYENRDRISADLYKHYKKLVYPHLSDQIAPYIKDKSRRDVVREFAIGIVAGCKLSTLAQDLASVALDESESAFIRISAAHAVANTYDELAKTKLKPLATGSAGNDPDDELKGYGLKALWPQHIGAPELFDIITPPKQELVGAYYTFLFGNLIQQLNPADLPVALKWAEITHWNGSLQFELERLRQEIMLKAFEYLDTTEVLQALANAIVLRLRARREIIGERYYRKLRPLLEDDEKRHKLLCAILASISSADGLLPLIEVTALLASSSDIPWIVEHLQSEQSGDMRLKLSYVASVIFDKGDPEQIGVLLDAYKATLVSREVFESIFEGVEIGSPTAERKKSEYREWLDAKKTNLGPKPLHPSLEERISLLLDRCEHDDSAFWANLIREMTLQPLDTHYDIELLVDLDLTTLPGWNSATEKTKTRIVAAAKKFLREQEIDTASWQDLQHISAKVLAGGQAIALLMTEEPKAVDDSSALGIWERWAPAVVAYPQYLGKRLRLHRRLAALAYGYARDRVLDTLSKLIDFNAPSDSIGLLDKFEGVWDEHLSQMVMNKVGSCTAPDLVGRLLDTLMRNDTENAHNLIRTFVTAEFPSNLTDPIKKAKAVQAASVVFARTDDSCWQRVWTLMSSYRAFGLEVLSILAESGQIDEMNLHNLNEKTLGDLYIWLVDLCPYTEDIRKGGGWVTAKERITWLRNSILVHLARLGSRAAVDEIREIVHRLPDIYPPKAALDSALKEMRLHVWLPPRPADIRSLAKNREVALVRNGSELIEVLINSLKNMEKQLHGERLAARFLWCEINPDKTKKVRWRPRLELDLSDWVSLYLEQNLGKRGIIAQREVDIRRNKADIFVTAFRKSPSGGAFDHITVIIETKCCWNRKLVSAMKTQLVNRYLKGTKYDGGIYLVGWHYCEKWDSTDNKWAQAQKNILEDPQSYFDNQAEFLSRSGPLVKAIVINTALD